MGERVLLNLGCGDKIYPGWINVDSGSGWFDVAPDVDADISKPLPFADGYADEIHGYHVVEHFWRWQVEDILADWVRVLKPGGLLVLECPCLEKVLGIMFKAAQERTGAPAQLTMHALYGDPRYRSESMSHKWIYSKVELGACMHAAGLREIRVKQPLTHVAQRDMRLIGWKPE